VTLKSLGKLYNYKRGRKILLRGGELPSLYSSVITSNSKPVGKVVDIIGPESDPFVVLKLDPRINLKELKGMKFYQGTHNNRRKSNGRKRSRVHRNMSRV